MKNNTIKEEMKNKKIVITYTSKENEINRDEGIYHSENEDFIIIWLPSTKLKYISKNKIIRIEEK